MRGVINNVDEEKRAAHHEPNTKTVPPIIA